MRRLLILSCSRRKLPNSGLMPAIERYDGGSFRVLRKARMEGYFPERLDVLILSSQYGLIDADTPIANYERLMNRARAIEIKTQVLESLRFHAQRNRYHEIYVDLSLNYGQVIDNLSEIIICRSVEHAHGRIGERLAQLKRWLFNKSMEDKSKKPLDRK